MAERTILLVTVFYAVTLFELYRHADNVYTWTGSFADRILLWPLWWTVHVPQETAETVLASLYLSAGILGVFLWRFRVVRVLVSIALLQNLAFENMSGSISHSGHEWFWISCVFWLLPSGNHSNGLRDRLWRTQMIIGYAAAGALILLFYSLSGWWKVGDAIRQAVFGQFGGFNLDAMAVVLAQRSLDTNTEPLLAWAIIDAPLIGWPLFLGLYFVELVAVIVLFRPELVRLWGAILVFFHIGTLVFMQIIFPDHVLINILLFWLAPWAIAQPGWREMLRALPFFGFLLRRLVSSPSYPVQGDAAQGLARSSGPGS
ncbi:MAG: hypothetical protein AAFV49_19985 [Pseudomonadota bacterium]